MLILKYHTVNRNESLKHLHRLVVGDILTQHSKYRIGTGNRSQNFRRTAHVDVICQTAGIAVACLDDSHRTGKLSDTKPTELLGFVGP